MPRRTASVPSPPTASNREASDLPRRRHRSNSDKHKRKGGGKRIFWGPPWDLAELKGVTDAGHLRVGVRGRPVSAETFFVLAVKSETFNEEPGRMKGWIDVPFDVWIEWVIGMGLWPYWDGKHSRVGQSYFTRLHSAPATGVARPGSYGRMVWTFRSREEVWRTSAEEWFRDHPGGEFEPPGPALGPVGPGFQSEVPE